MPFAYVKNRFVEADVALVSVRERAFRFGDGVFETIAVQDGVPYQWETHAQRLETGLAAIHVSCEISEIHQLSLEIIEKNCLRSGFLRLSVSRGEGSRGYLPSKDMDGPTVVIETMESRRRPDDAIDLWMSAYRRPPADVLPAGVKLMQGMNSSLARMEAREQGCFEALQLLRSEQGDLLCEGSSSNVFWLKDGVLYTPSLDCAPVAGTTRAAILRLSPWPVEEGRYPLEVLQEADAVAMTNVGWQAVAVKSLQPQGWQWQSDAFAAQLRTLLEEDMAAYVASHHA